MATTTSSRTTRSAPQQTPARNWLQELSTKAVRRPTALVLYGPPGIGKTSFGAAINGAVFMIDDQEDGINTLKSGGLVPETIPVFPACSHWMDGLGILDSLATEEHDNKALIVDTFGGMERLCHEHVCDTEFKGDWGEKGFASYAKGYEVALPHWREFLNKLDRCRDKGMSIILLGHSLVKPFKNPEGEDYDRYIPDLHHKTWAMTHKWSDMVLFCNYYVELDKSKSGRIKGKGGQDRVIHTEYHAAFEAKNRANLPHEIDMGKSGSEAWTNLRNAIAESKKGGAK